MTDLVTSVRSRASKTELHMKCRHFKVLFLILKTTNYQIMITTRLTIQLGSLFNSADMKHMKLQQFKQNLNLNMRETVRQNEHSGRENTVKLYWKFCTLLNDSSHNVSSNNILRTR